MKKDNWNENIYNTNLVALSYAGGVDGNEITINMLY